MKVSTTAVVAVISLGLLDSTANAFLHHRPLSVTSVRNSYAIAGSSRLHSTAPPKEDETTTKTSETTMDFSDPLRPVVKGETLLIPFSENEVDFGNGAVNDGPFSWIAPYLALGGYEPGAKLVGGIARKISPEDPNYEFKDEVYTKEEQEQRILAASEEIVNISPEERQRRREIAYASYVATAFYAFISANILIDDYTPAIADHLWRLAIFLPLSTGYGLQLSANRGL